MKDIEMINVNSSNIESIGYGKDEQVVYVRFLNGALYCYKDVQEHEFVGLLHSPSVGSYLHRNYKNVYPYERIE